MSYIEYHRKNDEEILNKPIREQFEYWWYQAQCIYNTSPLPEETPEETEYLADRYSMAVSRYMELKPMIKEEDNEKLILNDVMFLTFCPREDVKLNKSLEIVKKYVEKSKIENYIFVVEQRGSTADDIHGIHYHILHTHKYDRPTHYKRETQSTFNKYCDVKNWQCLNMSGCKTSMDVKKRLEYILYDKKDKAKQVKQGVDAIFRKNSRLCPYYTNDFTFWQNNYLNI